MKTEKIKSVPELRFPGFDGELESTILGDITKWSSGGTPSKIIPRYWEGDIPWISASTMRGTQYSTSDLHVSVEGIKAGSKLAVKGTLLLLVRGSMLWNCIPVGIATRDVAFNQDVKSLVPIQSLTSEYLLYWFLAEENNLLHKVVGTGIGAGKLDTDEMKLLDFMLPTLPEQQKIAEFLTAVDGRIAQLSRKKALLEDYKKGVMQQIFSQALRFKDEDGNEFPDWEEKTLGDIAKLISGQHLDPDQYDDSGEGVPYFTGPSDFTSDPSNFTKWTKFSSKVAPPDSVLICVKGNGVGKLMYSTLPQVAMGRQLMGIRSESYSNVLLYQFLLTKTQQFAALGSGNLIPGLSRPDILTFPIPAPSLPEQIKIANFLTSLDRKIESVAAQVTHTQTWKKGLLQQMFV